MRRALAGLGPQPPNFQAIVALNRGPLVLDEVHPRALTAHEVAARAADGALLIDVRSDRQFDEAHLPGAICVPMLHAGFGTKLAWIADPDRDVILVGRDERDARDASRLAEAVGVRRLVGLLGGGMTVWRDEARDVDRVERLEVGDLPARRNAERDLQGVRRASAASGSGPPSTARSTRPTTTCASARTTSTRGASVAVICASGQRSAVGASLLQRAGVPDVIHVVGGACARCSIDEPGRLASSAPLRFSYEPDLVLDPAGDLDLRRRRDRHRGHAPVSTDLPPVEEARERAALLGQRVPAPSGHGGTSEPASTAPGTVSVSQPISSSGTRARSSGRRSSGGRR